MIALDVLERLAWEKRTMAEYFVYLPIGDYILLVKQSMESFFTNAVFFRINHVLLSPPDYETDPVRTWSRSIFAEMTACFSSSYCVCKSIEWLSSLISKQKWKNYVSAALKFLLSFHSAVLLLADGRRVKKSDFKKMNIRPPWVCKQVFLVSLEISWSPGVWRKSAWSSTVGDSAAV